MFFVEKKALQVLFWKIARTYRSSIKIQIHQMTWVFKSISIWLQVCLSIDLPMYDSIYFIETLETWWTVYIYINKEYIYIYLNIYVYIWTYYMLWYCFIFQMLGFLYRLNIQEFARISAPRNVPPPLLVGWPHVAVGFVCFSHFNNALGIQSSCQRMIWVYNHLLNKVFRFHETIIRRWLDP